MEGAGLWTPDPKWERPGAMDRRRPVTTKQLERLERLRWFTRYFPAEHRPAVKAVIGSRRLRLGVASDLITVLSCVADASAPARQVRRHWKWPTVLNVPTLPGRVLSALEGEP